MSLLSILLFITIAPIILILIFVYQKDKEKEPLSLLIQFFGLGIFSCFLVLYFSSFLKNIFPFMNSISRKNLLDLFLYTFLGVSLLEEGCKWIMLYMRGYHTKEFDEIYDILVYSVFVSLGFAFFENTYFVFQQQDIHIAIKRALSAIPSHACDAIFMGYFLAFAKVYHYQKDIKKERKHIILSILIPIIMHGIYDFFTMSKIKTLVPLFYIFIIVLYIVSYKRLKDLSTVNEQIRKKSKYCKNCGAKLKDNICSKCGIIN